MAQKAKTPAPNLYSAHCDSRTVMDTVTSRWGVLILVFLLEKTYRFSEIRRKIEGVSEKMLAQSLQQLERDGFVLRKAYPVIPPKVEYSLTPTGREVARHMATLHEWIEKNLPKVMSARAKYKAPKN